MLMYFHSSSHTNPFVGLMLIVFLIIAAIFRLFQGRDVTPPRSLELQALAGKLAFTSFNPSPNYSFVMGWNFLASLPQGEDRYAFNILEGTYQDQKLFVFDYHFNPGRQREDGRDCTMLMLIVPAVFPQLLIGSQTGEDPLSRVAGLFSGTEIKLESAEFSRTFRVRSRDKKFAYDACNPQMMDYLLANRDLRIEIQGPVILLAFAGQMPVSDIEPNLERLAQIRALLPQYLFEQNQNK